MQISGPTWLELYALHRDLMPSIPINGCRGLISIDHARLLALVTMCMFMLWAM